MRINTPEKINLSDYEPYPFTIESVSLDFDLIPNKTKVKSIIQISLRQEFSEHPKEIILNGESLKLIDLKINDIALEKSQYSYIDDILSISTDLNNFKLETIVEISPIENTMLSGLYMSGGRYCTQCEAEGFRRITFWPDRPDVLTKFSVRIQAPKNEFPTLLSNGNLIESGEIGENNHYAIWEDPWQKPSYLFALVAGNFDVLSDNFTTFEGRNVRLNIYVDEGDSSKAHYALDSLKRAMKWDEENYSRGYDLDIFNIVAVRDFNFGAMENKGLNVFNSSLLLADEKTATDSDFANIESVIAHEYFHNWSGNRVTCRDWFQLSLKEGLTVFRDQEFSSDMRSRSVQRIQDVINLRTRQFAEDAGPNAHSVRPQSYTSIDNFYTATIYEKGAEIIRVAKNIIGDKAFFAGAKHYFEINDGKAATIEDWLFALREKSQNKLEGIEKWYSQAGTPIVSIETDYKDDVFEITINQETLDTPNQKNKDWVPIPLKLALFDNDGNQLEFYHNGKLISKQTINLNLNSKQNIFKFEGIKAKPIISAPREFSAPIILKTTQNIEDLTVLVSHDTDPFIKWESLQIIAKNEIFSGANIINCGQEYTPSDKSIDAFSNLFNDANDDCAYQALLLQLPSIINLINESENSKPENIFQAREKICKSIFDANSELIENAIAQYDFDLPFSPNSIDAGKRALHSMQLFYNSFLNSDTSHKNIYNAFKHAQNMTDKMGALSALSKIRGQYWQQALDEFYLEWHENDLVLDKWFSIQASGYNDKILETLDTLINHPKFNIANPNRVRSTIGSFALSNPVGFHAADGSAYEFVANQIIKIDKINPMIASRIATTFERVNKIEPKRRNLAKSYLENILQQNVSKQLQEIVSGINKSL